MKIASAESSLPMFALGGLATAGFVAGGALALTGVVLVAAAPRGDTPPRQAWITPIIGPGFAGAQGRF